MKSAALIVLFLIAVLVLWRLNGTKKPPLTFSGRTLHLHGGACSIELPSLGSEEELVDLLDISRHFLKLPNGAKIIYESVDFPATYDFSLPPDAIVSKIFGFIRFSVDTETRHIVLIKGEDSEDIAFNMLAVPEMAHRLEMIYPLDEETANIFAECLVKGVKKGFPNPSVTADIDIQPDWSESEIVKQNMIEKDM